MSQIALLSSGGSATAIVTLTGNSGGAVGIDAANNINIQGGIGINVAGNPATNTLTISDDDLVQGDVTTNNALPTACITFPLGVTPGAYVMDGRITGFNTSDIAGASYFFSAGARTTGAAGILIGESAGNMFEEAAMVDSDYEISVLGNDLILNVIGVAAKTINWSAEFEYQFVGV